MALCKPIFPNNIGIFSLDGRVIGFGFWFGLPPGTVALGGYWIMPVGLIAGVALLVVTQRLSRRALTWMRARKAPAWISIKVEVRDDR